MSSTNVRSIPANVLLDTQPDHEEEECRLNALDYGKRGAGLLDRGVIK